MAKNESETPPVADAPKSEIDKNLDMKRFSVRDVWILSSVIIVAATSLIFMVSKKDAEIKIQLNDVANQLDKLAEVQKIHNEKVSGEIRELKEDVKSIRDKVFH